MRGVQSEEAVAGLTATITKKITENIHRTVSIVKYFLPSGQIGSVVLNAKIEILSLLLSF
jgi:hypothetical protein